MADFETRVKGAICAGGKECAEVAAQDEERRPKPEPLQLFKARLNVWPKDGWSTQKGYKNIPQGLKPVPLRWPYRPD